MKLVVHFGTLHILFCDPLKLEDLARYHSILCLVPDGWTRSRNNPAILQLGTFGSEAQLLTSHPNSHA